MKSSYPHVVIKTDYYPFGMAQPGRQYNPTETAYGFNGKRSDDEIYGTKNAYNFGARIYDPRLGRWLSVDPKFKKYPNQSPYNFSVNSPVVVIDIAGADIKIVPDDPEKRGKIFNEIQKLTDHKLKLQENGKVAIVHKSKNPSKELGNEVVTQLVNSEKTHTIDVTSGGSETMPNDMEKATTPGVGSGTEVKINIENPDKVTLADNTVAEQPLQILVGHELLHSKHADEGKIKEGRADPEGKNYDPDLGGAGKPMLKEEIKTRKQENILRKEQNLDKRKLPIDKGGGKELPEIKIEGDKKEEGE